MANAISKEFDPYYKWLGIPPQEQPPNYYRLLGVTQFEDDPEVIAAAADRQMGHIKSFAAGRYAGHSQRLLNELAKARVCLLNASQKSKYDKQLRGEISAASLEHDFDDYFTQERESVGPPTFDVEDSQATPPPLVKVVPYRTSRRKRGRKRGNWVPVVLLVCTTIAGLILYKISRVDTGSRIVPNRDRNDTTLAVSEEPVHTDRLPLQPEPEATSPPSVPSLKAPQQDAAISRSDSNERQGIRQIPREILAEVIKPDIVIDLDLSERRQRVPLDWTEVRVVRFGGGGIADGIDKLIRVGESLALPLGGQVGATVKLTIESRSNGTFLLVEPIVYDGERELPFTLPVVRRQLSRAKSRYEKATNALAALHAERNELQTFIDAPITKSLAARGRARTRVMQIDKLIPGLQEGVARLAEEFATISQVHDLAQAVDERYTIELVGSQSDESQ